MPFINGVKVACAPCIRGHRSSKCNHASDRFMLPVRKPGRPLNQCPHKDPKACACSGATTAQTTPVFAAIPKGKPSCGSPFVKKEIQPLIAAKSSIQPDALSEHQAESTASLGTVNKLEVNGELRNGAVTRHKPIAPAPKPSGGYDMPSSIIPMEQQKDVSNNFEGCCSTKRRKTRSVSGESSGCPLYPQPLPGYAPPYDPTRVTMVPRPSTSYLESSEHPALSGFSYTQPSPLSRRESSLAFGCKQHQSVAPFNLMTTFAPLPSVLPTAAPPVEAFNFIPSRLDMNYSMVPVTIPATMPATMPTTTPPSSGYPSMRSTMTVPAQEPTLSAASTSYSLYDQAPAPGITRIGEPMSLPYETANHCTFNGTYMGPNNNAFLMYGNNLGTYQNMITEERYRTMEASTGIFSAEQMALSACDCGPMCSCPGCATHPYNTTMVDMVQAAYDDTQSPISPNSENADASSTSDQIQRLRQNNTTYDGDETLNPDDYLFVQYDYSHCSQCRQATGTSDYDCKCGDSCACEACEIHRHRGERTRTMSGLQQQALNDGGLNTVGQRTRSASMNTMEKNRVSSVSYATTNGKRMSDQIAQDFVMLGNGNTSNRYNGKAAINAPIKKGCCSAL